MIEAPIASPSSPSVRFTPFVVAVTRNQTQSRNSPRGRTIEVSRTKEIAMDAGDGPPSVKCSESHAKASATTAWPMSFVLARSPVLRCLKIFR